MGVNQAPRVNSGTALVNSDGSISVNFQSSDPEGSTMGADAYVMGLNGGFITKKTLNNYVSGSSNNISWTANELKNWNITNGNYYIAIDVFDNKGLQGTRFTSNNLVIQPPINQVPVGNGQIILAKGSEDTPYILLVSELLKGFTDPDADTLSVVNLQVANGSIVDNQNGTYIFTPNTNFNGVVNVTYQVSDGKGGIADGVQSFVVDAVNDSPVANDDDFSSNRPIIMDVLANDTDLDGDVLQVIAADVVQGGGIVSFDGTSVTYDPAGYNFNTTVLIEYIIQDVGGLTSTATISVHGTYIPPNTAPEASYINISGTEDDHIINGTVEGYDAEGSALSYQIVGDVPAGVVFHADGTFSVTPSAQYQALSEGQSSEIVFDYVANDGFTVSLPATVTVTINGVNDVPVLTGSPATLANGTEDIVYTLYASDLLQGFSDVDGDVLSVINLQATNGVLTDNQDGSYSFTPDANFNGTVDLNYQVSDGNGGVIDATNSFMVEAVNDAPTGEATAILDKAIKGQVSYTVLATHLLQGFEDADGDLLTISNLTADHATVVNNNNGTYTLTLKANYDGVVSLNYQVTDGQGGSINAIQVFNVLPNTTGTTGADTLIGGQSNDVYIVNNARDVVVEAQNNGGIDTVQSSFSYNLGLNLENLVLVGRHNLSGIGNHLDNILTGNEGNNRLLAGFGNDTLEGGVGSDTLNGGEGADVMYGGTGNDTFTVENPNDLVIEFANEGYDTINSFVTYTLAANVERLNLENAGGQINAFGNDLDNTLNGNNFANYLLGGAGNDSLQGKAGADTLEGGLGDDVYYVDDIGDVVTELAGEGTDKVNSTVSYSLTANIEQLFLTGIASLSGTGNAQNNIIYGNSGNNLLSGGAGNDSLNGGAGNDTLDGGQGNDTLVGGLGNDTYLLGVGSGRDTIDNKDSVGNDVLLLGTGVTAEQVWLRQLGNDLEVSIIGTNNSAKIKGWYGTDEASKIDSIQLSTGNTLLASEVQYLVEAMAAFTPPPIGQTTLTNEQQAALTTIITTSW